MRRGRPIEFDPERAIDAALALFWRLGYEGTSMAALSEAMGMKPPSIYAAFGNKEALFASAVARYQEKYGGYFIAALAQPRARLVAEKLMFGAIHQVTRPGHPSGCLLVQGALACNEDAEPARQVLVNVRAAAQAAIRERFEQAVAEGDLPAGCNPTRLARFVWTLNLGYAVQAAGGMTRRQLRELAKGVLASWPHLIQPDGQRGAHSERARSHQKRAR